jgi:hypothetical protein
MMHARLWGLYYKDECMLRIVNARHQDKNIKYKATVTLDSINTFIYMCVIVHFDNGKQQ